MSADDQNIAGLLDELIGVLAAAYQEADSRKRAGTDIKLVRTGRRSARRVREDDARAVRSLAARLARCASAGDYAGLDRLLSGQRHGSEWRRLVILLAGAADPARLDEPADSVTAQSEAAA